VTLSIIARSADAQMFGVAMASSSPAVAARCAHARAGVGAAASQNITDPSLGAKMLDALGRGLSARAALDEVLSSTPFGAYRQLLSIGCLGPPAIHSGAQSLAIVGATLGVHAAAAGNLLARPDVPEAMIREFDTVSGHLGARLLRALRAGAEHGGEAGPLHSAGLLIVREVAWPIVDLRVDWTEGDPVAELTALWGIFEPQIEDYVRRAVDPGKAPDFGLRRGP
jgi:uncharacterized Ntn-hydrolase superfamily protein